MDKLILKNSLNLKGGIKVSKAKNAYLPILAGVLLSDKKITLQELPNLRDVKTMIKLLGHLGVTTEKKENNYIFDPSKVNSHEATYDLVKTMRASICVLGPLLTRFGKAKVSLPGGCAIGTRPIDLHLTNLEKMGAEIFLESGYVEVVAKNKKLKGANLTLAFPSVGATENLMMAAVLAEGVTTIDNAALEPEVSDLANFLNELGAKVSGIGTKTLTIEGVESLNEAEYMAIGDRIEAGTYIMGALMTDSELDVQGFNPEHLDFVLDKLQEMGANLEIGKDSVKVSKSKLESFKIETRPYPGFPTDLQAQMMALALTIDGNSIIEENIFENRFMHVPELKRMGAQIKLSGNTAIIEGGKELTGAPVMCTDLRASAALVLTAFVAKGETEVQRIYHLDRGYDAIEAKLASVGGKIERIIKNVGELDSECLFCKIIMGDTPAEKVFENKSVIGFKDISPQAKDHFLFIHKGHSTNISEMTENDSSHISHIFHAIKDFAKGTNLEKKGYRIVTNQGEDSGQTVFHTHFHVLGGEPLGGFGRA